MYRCFERTRDALMSELQAHSLPQFSLLVFCERSIPSVDKPKKHCSQVKNGCD
jgi:hypothetical protein